MLRGLRGRHPSRGYELRCIPGYMILVLLILQLPGSIALICVCLVSTMPYWDSPPGEGFWLFVGLVLLFAIAIPLGCATLWRLSSLDVMRIIGRRSARFLVPREADTFSVEEDLAPHIADRRYIRPNRKVFRVLVYGQAMGALFLVAWYIRCVLISGCPINWIAWSVMGVYGTISGLQLPLEAILGWKRHCEVVQGRRTSSGSPGQPGLNANAEGQE